MEPTHAKLDRTSARRLLLVCLGSTLLSLIVFLWFLWDGSLDPLRRVGYADTFYETQARAMFHGHWWVPDGSLGIEAFVVNGHHYTYFGIFPALLRMPLLLVTSRFDGELTAPSMMLAWSVAAVFLCASMWRIRWLTRGDAVVTRLEAATWAIVIVAVLGGSQVLFLASLPWVFHEALLWGVAWTLATVYVMVRVLEAPSTWRVLALSACVLGAVLSRSTVGWACVLGGVGVAAYLAWGRQREERRWALPVLAAALVPFAVSCAITWMKFGGPFSLPLGAQSYPTLPEHRRVFLEANGGRAFAPKFLPTNLLAYFRPDGVHVAWQYPFVTMPSRPPRVVGDAVFDMTYRTSSVTATMPALLLLTVIGAIGVWRRRAADGLLLLRIPMLVAAAGAGGVLLFGFVVNRYVADLLPLLAVGSVAGVVELWRILDGRRRLVEIVAVGVLAALCAWSVLANAGIATQAPRLVTEDAALTQYVRTTLDVGRRLGHPPHVTVADRFPDTAPAGELWATPGCISLYVSTGELYFPKWLGVQRGPDAHTKVVVRYEQLDQGIVPLVSIGATTVSIEDAPQDWYRLVRVRLDGPGGTQLGPWRPLALGQARAVDVFHDLAYDRVGVLLDGVQYIEFDDGGTVGPVVVHDRPDPSGRGVQVVRVDEDPSALCKDIQASGGS